MKKKAKAFIKEHKGGVQRATEPSPDAKTYAKNAQFHLDRQQPTNKDGYHKVAIQLKNQGNNPSTIGQVVVNKQDNPSSKRVSFSILQIHVNSIQTQSLIVGCCTVTGLCGSRQGTASNQKLQAGENRCQPCQAPG